MDWYLKVLKNYVGFEGRARRKEFWMFVLFNFIVTIVLMVIDSVLGTMNAKIGLGMLSGLYGLATFLPNLAVSVRRLHDIDRSGWWLLIAFIPLIGAIMLIVWYATEGNRSDNRFGPDPKAGEEGRPVAA